jgi:hypothetical protein
MKEEEKCRPSPSKKIKSNKIKEKKMLGKFIIIYPPSPKKIIERRKKKEVK